MGDVINLRLRRKQRQRTEGDTAAALNRAKFGRPKAQRVHEEAEAARARAEIEGKKLTDGNER